MASTTINGNGWEANIINDKLCFFTRHASDGSDSFTIHLDEELPVNATVGDLRIMLVKNMNLDPVEITHQLNVFFTGEA